ncbi:phosphate ABC transporter permease subunit PstC [Caldisericum sp. AR60]|uniref:phosphate ABC transporter permease subunit PstC n=1 Tax=Caldisericum sp. AR60 TaxID=3397852 RepID=UPI0039FD7D1B
MKRNLIEYLLPIFGYIAILIVGGIIVVISIEGMPLLSKYSIIELTTCKEWRPTSTPPLFGFLPSIISTFFIAFFSMLFAITLSLGTAIYLSKLTSPKLRSILKPTIELLANIPSVIYGVFALLFLAPLIKKLFNLPIGLNGLNASIILAIMSIPTITTLSEDAISMVPKEHELASYALGASNLETIFGITLPSSLEGIFASIIAGFGRAIGETMAVLIASGNSIRIPRSILEPMRPITATIALEMAETPVGSDHYRALFLLALILLFLVLSFNLLSRYLKSLYRRKLYG